MKLLFAIIQNEDNKPLTRALIEHEISVTRISSSGGFLRGGNATLMIGVPDDQLQTALDTIKEHSCRRQTITVPLSGSPHNIDSVSLPMTVTVGGATVFVLDVADTFKF